tara:strand:- start:127 stop:834 length:708 start_codon:yes stop_codon:yes gene_type:complete
MQSLHHTDTASVTTNTAPTQPPPHTTRASLVSQTVAAIAYLNLLHSFAGVAAKTSRAVRAAIAHLTAITTAPTEHDLDHDALLTWRPLYCIDVAIFAPRAGEPTVLAVAMHGFGLDVQLFRAQSALPPTGVDSGFFCAHLTVDVHEGQAQPVLLVYDWHPAEEKHQHQLSAQARYARVQEACAAWEGCYVGHARVVRQWAGNTACVEELRDLRVPHARGDFVCLGRGGGYRRIKA